MYLPSRARARGRVPWWAASQPVEGVGAQGWDPAAKQVVEGFVAGGAATGAVPRSLGRKLSQTRCCGVRNWP